MSRSLQSSSIALELTRGAGELHARTNSLVGVLIVVETWRKALFHKLSSRKLSAVSPTWRNWQTR